MLLFAAFGMLACQLTYFLCVQYSNPATATVLQYTSPVMIMILCLFLDKKLPRIIDILVLIAVVAGVFLMSTHGDIHTLAISQKALILGMIAAVTIVFYTVWPVSLLREFGSPSLLAGECFLVNHAGTIFKILGTIRKVGWVYGNISWNRYYFWNRMCIYLLFKRSHVFRTGKEQSVFLYGAACLNNSYNHSTAPDICHGRSCRNCSHYYQRDFVSSK